MDHLTDLLNHATSAETPAGQQRVQEIIGKLRDTEDVDLSALETTAQERFEEMFNGGEYDPDNLNNLDALADIVDAARNLGDEQRREREERDQKVAALAERVRTAPESDEPAEAEEPGEQDEPSEDNPDEETESPSEESTEPTEDESNPSPAPAEGRQRQSEPAKQPVAAAGGSRPSTASALSATRTPKNPAPREEKKPLRSYSVTAAAEVPDVPFGKQIDQSELAEAALNRFASMPVGQPTEAPIKANVGRVHREFPDEFSMTGEDADIKKIDQLADEKRLPGGSLTAAAQKAITASGQAPSMVNDVWCSVSETQWDFCQQLATTEGRLDLPTTGLPRRGGIRYPIWKTYPEQLAETADWPKGPDGNNAAFPWHGQVVAHPNDPNQPDKDLQDPAYFHKHPKNCISGPCVEWAEQRMSVEYLCVTSDILRDRTFPEATERFISDVMVHHAHYMNEIYINHILANSTVLDPFSVQDGAGQWSSTSYTVTDRIALLVTWFRNAYKMSAGTTLEIVAPEWFREFLKRDIEQKSNRPYGTVSDAEVADRFAQYTSRVQWVRGLDDTGLWSGHTPYAPGDSTTDPATAEKLPTINPPTAWPDNVKMLAYPAGSWVLFQGNILNLGVQYDYQLLQENRYSALFTEDAWMLLNRCNRSFVLQLKDLCNSGAVGGQMPPKANYACPPKTPAGSSSDTEPAGGSSAKSGGQKKQ